MFMEGVGDEQVVKDVSTIEDQTVREAVETALTNQKRGWRSNRLPDGLTELLDRIDFFTGNFDSEYTHVGLTLYRFDPDDPPAIEFDVSLLDDRVVEGSPGVIELSLKNVSSEMTHIHGGADFPFGPLNATRIRSDEEFLLWQNFNNFCGVGVMDRGVSTLNYAVRRELKSQHTIDRRYRILPGSTSHHPDLTVPPGPGEYITSGTVEWDAGDDTMTLSLAWHVGFTLEAA